MEPDWWLTWGLSPVLPAPRSAPKGLAGESWNCKGAGRIVGGSALWPKEGASRVSRPQLGELRGVSLLLITSFQDSPFGPESRVTASQRKTKARGLQASALDPH